MEEILYVSRRESGCHLYNEIDVDVFRIELRQELLQNSLSAVFVETADSMCPYRELATKDVQFFLAGNAK
jgi:hypothetical protein